MGPDSFQWCPKTGQGTVGTNWKSLIFPMPFFLSYQWRDGYPSSWASVMQLKATLLICFPETCLSCSNAIPGRTKLYWQQQNKLRNFIGDQIMPVAEMKRFFCSLTPLSALQYLDQLSYIQPGILPRPINCFFGCQIATTLLFMCFKRA